MTGTVQIDPATGMHGFDATGPTTLVLLDPPGNTVTIKAASGADQVSIAGLPDAELVDGAWATFAFWRGAWELASAGGASIPAVPDTTPPSSMTGLSVTPGTDGTTATATWSAAADAESAVRYRLRVYPTGGTVPPWPTSGSLYNISATSKNLADLTPSTAYTIDGQAYSAGGSSTTAATATFTTPAAPPVEPTWTIQDTFTATDGTSLNGRTTPVGGATYLVPTDESQAGGDWGIITSNAIPSGASTFNAYGGVVAMASADVAGEISYDLSAGAGSVNSRAYLWVSTASSTDALSVQVRGDGTIACYKGSAAEVILSGVTSGIDTTGTLRVTWDNGALTITSPAGTATATVAAGSAGFTGTGRRLGFGARGPGAKVDNFKAANL